MRAKLQKAHDSTNPSPPHVTPHPHRTVSCPVSFTPSRPVFPLPRATHLDDVAVHRFASRNNLYYQRPRFRVRTHARTQPQKSARRLAPRRAADADRQEPEAHPASRAQTKPNQTAHDTHSHNRTHARPPTFPPLSLSFSLAGRCVFALILAAASPRPPSQLAQSFSRPPHKYSPCLSSLSRLASERTNGRASGERGEPEAGGLCASVSLLPSSPPSPFSALLSIPAVQVSSLALFFVGDEMRLVTNLVALRGALRLVVLCGFFPWISVD